MRRAHTHRADPTVRQERAFAGCVRPYHCTQGAHGNIVVIDTCRCGAERKTNSNQGWIERGSWRQPEREEVRGS